VNIDLLRRFDPEANLIAPDVDDYDPNAVADVNRFIFLPTEN